MPRGLLVQQVSLGLRDAFGAGGVNVLNASGLDSDQSVDHLHFHVVPRWADDGPATLRSIARPAE